MGVSCQCCCLRALRICSTSHRRLFPSSFLSHISRSIHTLQNDETQGWCCHSGGRGNDSSSSKISGCCCRTRKSTCEPVALNTCVYEAPNRRESSMSSSNKHSNKHSNKSWIIFRPLSSSTIALNIVNNSTSRTISLLSGLTHLLLPPICSRSNNNSNSTTPLNHNIIRSTRSAGNSSNFCCGVSPKESISSRVFSASGQHSALPTLSSSGRRHLCVLAVGSHPGGDSNCKRSQSCSKPVAGRSLLYYQLIRSSSPCSCCAARREVFIPYNTEGHSASFPATATATAAEQTLVYFMHRYLTRRAAAHALGKRHCCYARRTISTSQTSAASSCFRVIDRNSASFVTARVAHLHSTPLSQHQQQLQVSSAGTCDICSRTNAAAIRRSRCDGQASGSCSASKEGKSYYDRKSCTSSVVVTNTCSSDSTRECCASKHISCCSSLTLRGGSCGETCSGRTSSVYSSNSTYRRQCGDSSVCFRLSLWCCRKNGNSSSRGNCSLLCPSFQRIFTSCFTSPIRSDSKGAASGNTGNATVDPTNYSLTLAGILNGGLQRNNSRDYPSNKGNCSSHPGYNTRTPTSESENGLRPIVRCIKSDRKGFNTSSLIKHTRIRRYFSSESQARSSCNASQDGSSAEKAEVPHGCLEIMESAAGERWMQSHAVSLHLVRTVGLEYLRAVLSSRGISLEQEQTEPQEHQHEKKKLQSRQQEHWQQQRQQQTSRPRHSLQKRPEETDQERRQRELETEQQQVFNALWQYVMPLQKDQWHRQPQKRKQQQANALLASGEGISSSKQRPETIGAIKKRTNSGSVTEDLDRMKQIESLTEKGDVASSGSWPVHAKHLCMFFKGCMQVRLRELEVLDALCEILAVLLEAPQAPDVGFLVDLADACTALCLWRPQLFEVMAECLLRSLRAPAIVATGSEAEAVGPAGGTSSGKIPHEHSKGSSGEEEEVACVGACVGGAAVVEEKEATSKKIKRRLGASSNIAREAAVTSPADMLQPYQVVVLLEAYSYQRLRHTELLQLLESFCLNRLHLYSPRLCCRLLHAFALLRRPPQPPELFAALLEHIKTADPLAAVLSDEQNSVKRFLYPKVSNKESLQEEKVRGGGRGGGGEEGTVAERNVAAAAVQHEKQHEEGKAAHQTMMRGERGGAAVAKRNNNNNEASTTVQDGGDDNETNRTALQDVHAEIDPNVHPGLMTVGGKSKQHARQILTRTTTTTDVAVLRLVDLVKIAHALFLLELEIHQQDFLLKLCCW